MLTKNQNPTPIYFDAEIVDERTQHIEGEHYDRELVQEQITETDGGVTVLRGIAQGAVLAGFQVTSMQSLYLAGCVGLFPAVIAGLPVGLSVAGALCYLRFENSFIPTISDRKKFGLGVTRTLMLAASSWKLTADAQQMDSIARNSFLSVAQQVKQYEAKKELCFYPVSARVYDAPIQVEGQTQRLLLGNKYCRYEQRSQIPEPYLKANQYRTSNPNYNCSELLSVCSSLQIAIYY